MTGNIRDRAREILKDLPPLGQQVHSNGSGGPDGKTNPLFYKMTNTKHSYLTGEWDKGSIVTTCNGFVGWYGDMLGSKKALGQFEMEKNLKRMGKAHAWVKAAPGLRPKYGDIFRPKKFHMGISLDFEGDMWNTAESGQGGRKSGFDILKRKQTPWNVNDLQGWIDIELYFGVTVQPGPVPEWLLGWWNVSWRTKPFFYYFERSGDVRFTRTPPQDTTQRLLAGIDTGKFVLDINNAVTIKWGATGAVEKLTKAPGIAAGPMKGTWEGKEPITAVKM
jgi:hypothetical protein